MLPYLFCLVAILLAPYAYADKDIHEGRLKVMSGDKELRFSGYIDGYYAHDFSNPDQGEVDFEKSNGKGGRDYTSNPLYDQQFSLGYGFFQLEFEHKNIGYRFAYQFGDIVQKMYADESERNKNIREASINIRLNDELLLEVGYMPSVFGFETFINKENLHASRAYMTDFAPDFDAGVRLYWQKSKRELIKFQITNGWQVERDKNKEKALGLVYVYNVPKQYEFNWGQFIGDEAIINKKTSYRYYNNLFAKIYLSDKWILAPMLDVGWEQLTTSTHKKSWAPWQSYGLSARYALAAQHGVAARFDRTFDPNTIIPELKSGSAHGWITNGYTLTYEYLYNAFATFRIEARYVKSRDRVFKTSHPGQFMDEDAFLMSQLAMSF